MKLSRYNLEKFFISVNGLENQIVEFFTSEKKPHRNFNNTFFNSKSTQHDLTSAGTPYLRKP